VIVNVGALVSSNGDCVVLVGNIMAKLMQNITNMLQPQVKSQMGSMVSARAMQATRVFE
jgi:hypothetical protein